MVKKSGLVMAFRTSHMSMAGGPPRLHIDIHLVTEAAKGRALCKFEKAYKDDKKNKDTKNKKDPDGLEVSESASLRLIEEIDPKDLDQIIKISYSSHIKAPAKTQFYNVLKLFQVKLSPAEVVISVKRGGDRGRWGNRFILLSHNREVV
jgi:hypothetical protein